MEVTGYIVTSLSMGLVSLVFHAVVKAGVLDFPLQPKADVSRKEFIKYLCSHVLNLLCILSNYLVIYT